jgi:serine-type D-Ala-D-Ala carboxypeptidase (penicillin-binding protein 5/6)
VARHRRGRHGPSHRTLVVAGVAFGVLVGGGLVAAASVPLPKGPPALVLAIPPAPGASVPRLAFPSQGEAALAIPSLRFAAATPTQTPVPIASLTKLMTAYVALRELPLTPDEQGPTIVVTSSDVAEYHRDLREGNSCVKVAEGTVLTERNLLDGMLVHSADNYASLLGRMVAGNDEAMVDEMNAQAGVLGLRATHYADVSGLDPDSQSSAVDILHLAVLLLRNATFAAIVRQTSVVLPVAGEVTTYQPYLGKPGVVGVKTGTTHESKGCDVLAFNAQDAGRVVQIVSVVLGQQRRFGDPEYLVASGRAALVLASSAAHQLRSWRVTTAHAGSGVIGWPSSTVPVVSTTTIEVPTFGAVPATSTVTEVPWGANEIDTGQHVATVVVTSGTYRQVSPLVAAASLTRPSLWQRLR